MEIAHNVFDGFVDDEVYELTFYNMLEQDIPFFNEVRNLCRNYLHDPTEFTVEESMEWFKTTKPEFYTLLHQGRKIGYFRTSDRTENTLQIGLDIHPKYQSMGLAIPAYRFFMKYMNLSGIETFTLNVLSSNTRAIQLYKQLGFVETEVHPLPNRQCVDMRMQYKYNAADDVFDDFRFIGSKLTRDELLQFQGTTIVITGATGFLGNWLIKTFEYLISKHNLDIKIYAHDISEELNISSMYTEYKKLDITDKHKLDDYYRGRRVDYIFNCAGIANPSAYMRKPIETLDVSYIGTKNILDLSLEKRVKSVMCFSSSEVYGTPEPESIPTKETHIGRINTRGNRSCYDVGKLVLETLCHVYYEHYGVPIKTIRPFNLYGPFMDDTRVIPNFMRKVIWQEPLNIYGDGMQTRTFCYVADAIVMLLKLTIHGKNGAVYNVGTSYPEVSIPTLVKHISTALGIELESNFIKYPNDYPNDEPLRRCPRINAMIDATHYGPCVGLELGLKNTFNYFKTKMT